jgi:hypothetical protein
MDITNNVVIQNNQSGGKVDKINVDNIDNIDTDGLNNTKSSDFDVSSDVEVTEVVVNKRKKGGAVTVLNENDIIDILNGNFTKELENYNIKDIIKIPYYNKLTDNQKSLLTTRLYEKLPKNQKINKNIDNGVVKESYFYCKSCGYYEKIPDKTFIFSRSFDKNNNIMLNNNFINYKYDNTLPYSKKYTCENKECATHKNPSIKNAVFYRLSNTYNIRYICTICDHYWNTVDER